MPARYEQPHAMSRKMTQPGMSRFGLVPGVEKNKNNQTFRCFLLQKPLSLGLDIAGWSSLVARWAHNPKVGGSNPPPATKKGPHAEKLRAFFVFVQPVVLFGSMGGFVAPTTDLLQPGQSVSQISGSARRLLSPMLRDGRDEQFRSLPVPADADFCRTDWPHPIR